MSLAWETTEDDVLVVLMRHKLHKNSTILRRAMDALEGEGGRIEEAILHYDDMDDQTNAAMNEIEDILIEENVLAGPKLFNAPTDLLA
jgi:ABC-type transporter Mla subunit MlaD